MSAQPVRWVVVEMAGMVGERDIYTADTYRDAEMFMYHTLEEDEIGSLHVDICQEFANGDRLYEY